MRRAVAAGLIAATAVLATPAAAQQSPGQGVAGGPGVDAVTNGATDVAIRAIEVRLEGSTGSTADDEALRLEARRALRLRRHRILTQQRRRGLPPASGAGDVR